ncbi:MAG: EamA family transporter [Saprospiraceae bacterium]|uniref:EamA family transporter n=1 Tax=Candidatus Opimibacter skivensis TaxID=2982028 RepID=A0A9D7ST71_9BACT|nr:EamA family transporter [Candidatus Opimibacter skivensis]
MGLRRTYIELHIAVVLLAMTAILGDLITLSASVLVWWRTLIASVGIGLFLLITRKLKMEWIRGHKKIYVLGGMIALHWICFFGSVKMANASTALICFATISLFTSFIEPWITKRKRETHEVLFGLLVIPGIVLIAGHAEGKVLFGIILGLVASLLISIVASFEKKWITETDPEHMVLLQMAGAWLAMCAWLSGEYFLGRIDHFIPQGMDIIYLLILGLVCTCVAWVLATRAIRTITAFDSMIVINLEPVYGIVLALIILNDGRELTLSFYLGASIILASVFIHPIWQSRHART